MNADGCWGPRKYVIAAGGRSITFYPCGTTSHHLQDVENLYCARCHRVVGDEAAHAEMWSQLANAPGDATNAKA